MSKLHLEPRSDSELHATLDGLELKWRQKARRVLSEMHVQTSRRS